MAKSGEFYTFDEVVRQLKIDEGKLKRLVSEGEISAFREGDVMKFKRTEIDKLATKGTGSETSETVLSEITLEDEAPAFEESGETLTDDLVFESSESESIDQIDLGSDSGMVTEEISSQDTFIEDAGDDVGMSTEPIDISADLTQEVDDDEIEEIAAPRGGRQPAVQRTRTRTQTAAAPASSPGMTFALVLSSLVLILGTALAIRTSGNETTRTTGESRRLDGMFRSLTDFVYEQFGTDQDVGKKIRATTQNVNNAALGTSATPAPDGGAGN
jgi:excisionase family DNA binding protein